jgi:hypothetical protein
MWWKLITYWPVAKPILIFTKGLVRYQTDKIIVKKIDEKLTKYDLLIKDMIKKSYKNLILDFVLIIIMLMISFHAKMKSYEFIMLLSVSCVYSFTMFLIFKRTFEKYTLYKKNQVFIKKYFKMWIDTKAPNFKDKRIEFIRLAYIDFYKMNVNLFTSTTHGVLGFIGLTKSKDDLLEAILDRVKYIFRNNIKKELILYIITFILVIVCSYLVKLLLINVNTGFVFYDYIFYPFKQLIILWS